MEYYIHWESLFPTHSKTILDLDFKASTYIYDCMFIMGECQKALCLSFLPSIKF